jgi:hypothetical protein
MDSMRGVPVVVLGGCDLVYGLGDRVEPIDAAIDGCDRVLACVGRLRARHEQRSVHVLRGDRRTGRLPRRRVVWWSVAFSDCRDDSMTGITHLIVFDDVTELAFVKAASPTRPGVRRRSVGSRHVRDPAAAVISSSR